MNAYETFYTYFLFIMRIILPLIALSVVALWFRALIASKPRTGIYAVLQGRDGARFFITSPETSVGRKSVCDIHIDNDEISKISAVLTKSEHGFIIKNLNSDDIRIDGAVLEDEGFITAGETISFGGYDTKLLQPTPSDVAEVQVSRRRSEKRKPVKSPNPFLTTLLLSLFTMFTGLELCLKYAADLDIMVPIAFGILIIAEWVCHFITRARGGYMWIELPAFFLTTLGFAVCTTAAVGTLKKEVAAWGAGLIFFIILSLILSKLELTMKLRYVVGIAALALMGINLILGYSAFGARNAIDIFGLFTIQPSEFVKVAFVFAGAATLQHLLTKRNFLLFMLMTGGIMGALVLINDFGSLAIFFVTMLVIIFMRTGNVLLVGGILGAAGVGGFGATLIVPHITQRFAVWGHVWQDAADRGFQQTRTMIALGSGGLLGVGGGNGYLQNVFAADTDLVFGLIFEEWGGIIALCAVAIIVGLGIYAFWLCKGVKSAYYSVAVCAVAAMFLFQTGLHIFGSTDILPLTGVTMPFVSNGGTSIVASWGLLAFFKAAAHDNTLERSRS